ESPFVMLKTKHYHISGNERFEGFLIDVINHILRPLNVDFEIRLASQNKYGKLRNSFFWDGAIGEVHRGTADIAIGPLVVLEEANETIDYTEPYLSLKYSALIAKPTIKDLSKLVESGMTCGMIENSHPYTLFNRSTYEDHKVIFSKMSNAWPGAYVQTRQEGVERARMGNFAFIIDTPIAEFEAGKKPCDLYTTEPFLDVVDYAFIIAKNATL
ncbi:hypothetical protein HELRODRAFT_149492, partial [Helobdella robusta]|uniref:Ionotropic glutamate receptor L-glutamate and glycine-binding domain-containing protein n=1 Tax=Helobdella robusta TaxID=6412 RepID=T1EKD0_HELRO